ncbi:hypothetical protein [Anaerobaca lacustris]|uniref:Transporter n=1 Tax=Anaerobaca lacustris TaxID=3044600 RepID=A0AAW6TZF6_9BACT|nr:hypothetical protein [Sedimentisphaerales bacterium M17dextr]
MKTKRGILGLVLGLIVLPGPAARGAGVMGPPIAILEEGQWTVGLEYGYAETGLKAHGTRLSRPQGEEATYGAEFIDIKGLNSRMVFGSLAYGVVDNWDLFLRLGTADAWDHAVVRTPPFSDSPERFRYDGDYGLAYGLGTRATFCYWGPWQFGGTTQVTWMDPGKSRFSWSDSDTPDTITSGRTNVDFWHVKAAVAATYQIDAFRFWAGPFVQFVRGDFRRRGETFTDGLPTGSFTCSADIEETSQAGVHFGAIWQASRGTNCWIEGQYTNDSWVFGLGATVVPARFLAGR